MENNLRARYQQFGIDFVVRHGRASADAVVDAVFDAFRDEIETAWARLSREAVRRDLKSAFKRLEASDDVAQTSLPGFALPKVIALPREGGATEYIDTTAATKDEAYAARQVREMNIVNAVRKRDEWDRTLDRLRPAWNVNPDWTIGECIDYLAGLDCGR